MLRSNRKINEIFGFDPVIYFSCDNYSKNLTKNSVNLLKLCNDLDENKILSKKFEKQPYKVLALYGVKLNDHVLSNTLAAGLSSANSNASNHHNHRDILPSDSSQNDHGDHGNSETIDSFGEPKYTRIGLPRDNDAHIMPNEIVHKRAPDFSDLDNRAYDRVPDDMPTLHARHEEALNDLHSDMREIGNRIQSLRENQDTLPRDIDRLTRSASEWNNALKILTDGDAIVRQNRINNEKSNVKSKPLSETYEKYPEYAALLKDGHTINSVKKELNYIENKINECNKQMKENEETLNSLNNDRNTIQDRINELNGQLSNQRMFRDEGSGTNQTNDSQSQNNNMNNVDPYKEEGVNHNEDSFNSDDKSSVDGDNDRISNMQGNYSFQANNDKSGDSLGIQQGDNSMFKQEIEAKDIESSSDGGGE